MKRYVFIKKRESLPIIEGNKIINPGAGGVKLEYKMYATDNFHMRIGKRDIYIPYWKYRSRKLVFMKLLKEYWDNKMFPLAKNFWPKTGRFTNLWTILQSRQGNFECYEDIIDIKKDYKSLRIRTQCTKNQHHSLIKNLDKQKEKFSIPYVQIIF